MTVREHGLRATTAGHAARHGPFPDGGRDHRAGPAAAPLVQIEERGDTLNELEVMTTCGLLLVAGHETTASLAPTPST